MISPPLEMKILPVLAEVSWKKKLNFYRSALFLMKTRFCVKYFYGWLNLLCQSLKLLKIASVDETTISLFLKIMIIRVRTSLVILVGFLISCLQPNNMIYFNYLQYFLKSPRIIITFDNSLTTVKIVLKGLLKFLCKYREPSGGLYNGPTIKFSFYFEIFSQKHIQFHLFLNLIFFSIQFY